MTLPARTASFPDLAAPCQHCHAAEALLPTGCCLECAVAIAHDAHDRALLEHARRGGSYATRPVFVHPARALSGAELAEGLTRLAAWHAWLATHPEARTLTRGAPHDAGGTAASQGAAGGRTTERYETRDAESSPESPVLTTPEVAR
jgi:hypothetical protein